LSSGGFGAVGLAHQFGPEGTTFGSAVTITLPYDPSSLPTGMTENQLVIGYWNPVAGAWQPLNTQVDAGHKRLSAQTSHFSTYQPLVPGVADYRPAIPTSVPVQAYGFPSPSHDGQPITIRTLVGQADGVDVAIMEATGRVVRSARVNAPTVVQIHGAAQYAYDYVWDLGGAGTGIYMFKVTAHKAGAGPIVKTGKIVVIR
jgi:hypothetical protein